MAKMGWEEGRGLGAREDGVQSHVKVHLKNDQLGACMRVHARNAGRCSDNWAPPLALCSLPSAFVPPLLPSALCSLGIGAKRTSNDNWLENVSAFDQLLSSLNQSPAASPSPVPSPSPSPAPSSAAPLPAKFETKRNQLYGVCLC